VLLKHLAYTFLHFTYCIFYLIHIIHAFLPGFHLLIFMMIFVKGMRSHGLISCEGFIYCF
jgi:hypothetical protein